MQQLVLLNSSHPGLVLFCKFGAEIDRHLRDEHHPRGPPRGEGLVDPPGLKRCIFGSQHPKMRIILTLEICAGPSSER